MEESGEVGQAVGINQIDTGGPVGFPHLGAIGGAPEAEASALVMGLLDPLLQAGALVFGEGAIAVPGEMGTPMVTDQRDEVGAGVGEEIGETAIDGDPAFGFCVDEVAGAITGEDDGDGAGDGTIGVEGGEKIAVGDEHVAEAAIGGVGFGFEIDEQGEGGEAGMDLAMVVLDALAEGIEVKGLEGAIGMDLGTVVSDEQLVSDQEDIGFHAAEALVEGIEQGARMFVVIVGMGAGQGEGSGVGCGEGVGTGGEEQGEDQAREGREERRHG